MENYRKELGRRLTSVIVIMIIAIGVFTAGIAGVFEKIKPDEEHFASYLSGFQTGLFSVLIVFSIIKIVSYTKALKNDDKLKALYVKENDERTAAIREKAGYNLFTSVTYLLLLATIVAGYFSVVVFFTLLATVFFIEIIFTALSVHYKNLM